MIKKLLLLKNIPFKTRVHKPYHVPAAKESERAEANSQNRKSEAKDFEKVYKTAKKRCRVVDYESRRSNKL